MTPSEMLVTLVLGGLMGLLGQGARAAVGLKTMTDDAKSLALSPNDMFQAARLITSLLIGFLVGLAAALIYLSGLKPGDAGTLDWHVLLGFASSGYLGTDILEGLISKYLAPTPQISAGAVAAKQSLLMTRLSSLSVKIPITAKQFVYSVLQESFPGITLTDDTKLSALGLDPPALDGLATIINQKKWHGVFIDNPTIEACTKISDLTDAVAKAMK